MFQFLMSFAVHVPSTLQTIMFKFITEKLDVFTSSKYGQDTRGQNYQFVVEQIFYFNNNRDRLYIVDFRL